MVQRSFWAIGSTPRCCFRMSHPVWRCPPKKPLLGPPKFKNCWDVLPCHAQTPWPIQALDGLYLSWHIGQQKEPSNSSLPPLQAEQQADTLAWPYFSNIDQAALAPSQSYNFSDRATVDVCAECPVHGHYADYPTAGLPHQLPAWELLEGAERPENHIFSPIITKVHLIYWSQPPDGTPYHQYTSKVVTLKRKIRVSTTIATQRALQRRHGSGKAQVCGTKPSQMYLKAVRATYWATVLAK